MGFNGCVGEESSPIRSFDAMFHIHVGGESLRNGDRESVGEPQKPPSKVKVNFPRKSM